MLYSMAAQTAEVVTYFQPNTPEPRLCTCWVPNNVTAGQKNRTSSFAPDKINTGTQTPFHREPWRGSGLDQDDAKFPARCVARIPSRHRGWFREMSNQRRWRAGNPELDQVATWKQQVLVASCLLYFMGPTNFEGLVPSCLLLCLLVMN